MWIIFKVSTVTRPGLNPSILITLSHRPPATSFSPTFPSSWPFVWHQSSGRKTKSSASGWVKAMRRFGSSTSNHCASLTVWLTYMGCFQVWLPLQTNQEEFRTGLFLQYTSFTDGCCFSVVNFLFLLKVIEFPRLSLCCQYLLTFYGLQLSELSADRNNKSWQIVCLSLNLLRGHLI